jgi:hypothetical protein
MFKSQFDLQSNHKQSGYPETLITLEIFQQASSGVLLFRPTLERFQRFRVTRLFAVTWAQVRLFYPGFFPIYTPRDRSGKAGGKCLKVCPGD